MCFLTVHGRTRVGLFKTLKLQEVCLIRYIAMGHFPSSPFFLSSLFSLFSPILSLFFLPLSSLFHIPLYSILMFLVIIQSNFSLVAFSYVYVSMIYFHFSPPNGPLPCSLSHLLFKYYIAILQKMKLILTFSSVFRHYNHLQLLLISHDLLFSHWSLPYTKHLLFYLQARCMCMYAYI